MAQTCFFRDKDVLDLIISNVIPEVSTQREIRIWDAGCASGEEVYSVAMIFAENLNPFAFRSVFLDATDREESSFPQFERIIRAGQYDKNAVIFIPEDIREKYVQSAGQGDLYEIVPELRSRVTYRKHDLTSLEIIRTDYSLIVCKNVLMHIDTGIQPDVVRMFHQSLRDPGYLALDRYQEMPADAKHLFKKVSDGGNLFLKV
jgi:chemotaxis protein methyltransferase CheR